MEANDCDSAGEYPIPGVELYLLDGTITHIATTTTDLNGAFNFGGFPPGKYTVIERNLPLFVDVAASDGGNTSIISVNVRSGDSFSLIFVDMREIFATPIPTPSPTQPPTPIPTPLDACVSVVDQACSFDVPCCLGLFCAHALGICIPDSYA